MLSRAALVVGMAACAERLAPTDQAVFRLDAHHQDFKMSPRLAGEKWRWATHVERQGNDGTIRSM